MKQYRDMSEAERLAWGASESTARKADLTLRGDIGLSTAQANAKTRAAAIGATTIQAADMVVKANRRARMGSVAAPIYVVVCNNDKPFHADGEIDPGGPIVHESYTSMTLDQAHQRASVMERWGACRIGRVVFEGEPGFEVKS